MALTSLSVENLRRITHAEINPGSRVNIIFGENGSGKTSLLESIHFLGTGRSFRTPRVREVIRYDTEGLTVTGRYDNGRGLETHIGLMKTGTATQIRINGKSVGIASEVAKVLPILTYTSESLAVLNGGPSNRRALLDRLLFHVEQDYFADLKAYYQALKHRNVLLRTRALSRQLAPWEEQLVVFSGKIDKARNTCVNTLNADLQNKLLIKDLGKLQLEYYRGWQDGSNLATLLKENIFRDQKLGSTSVGPHRAEIRILLNGKPAKAVVSRGQGKRIVAALVTSQTSYVNTYGRKTPVVLVDDLAADLDESARQKTMAALIDTNAQLFITCIQRSDLPQPNCSDMRMFHVEHGVVNAQHA